MSVRDARLSWPQALAWRMRRQMLDPVGSGSVEDVVGRLGAIQSQSDPAAALSIDTRRDTSRPDDLARTFADGRIIRTFAFRGATQYMTPEDAGIYLALRAASRMWELPSWQTFYGLTPADWPALREVVRDALTDGPLTRDELGAAITARPRFRHLGFVFETDAWTLLKPFAWQGDMSFGPRREGRATFQRLDQNPRWAGIPDLEEAGPRAIEAYVRTYGPAPADNVHYWLGSGLGAGRKRIQAWITGFGDRLAMVDIDGEPAYVMRDDLEELAGTRPNPSVRLLPGFDQWLFGPGTADAQIVPSGKRAVVNRGANIVIIGGVVSGTWTVADDRVTIVWFADERPTAKALAGEVARLATILDRPLDSTVETAS